MERNKHNAYLEWRARFLQQIIVVTLILGGLTMLFSLPTNLRNDKHVLILLEGAAFFLMAMAALYKGMSFKLRSALFLSIFYLVGLSLLVTYGPTNNTAYITLAGFAILTPVLLGEKSAYFAISLLLLTFVTVLFLLKIEAFTIDLQHNIGYDIFVIVMVNAFILTGLVTFIIAKMVNRLKNSLIEANHAQEKLKKQNEELNIKNELLDQFIYRSAHDMKGPLSSILGLVNVTSYDISDAQSVTDNLDRIVGNVNRLENYLTNIVDFSMTSKVEQKYDNINFRDLANQVFENFKDTDNCKLIVESDCEFMQDSERLTAILNNLMSNSIKYRDPDKNSLEVKIRCQLTEGWVRIEISDNGVGISKDKIDDIFGLFYRGDERSDGSGLGLYLAQMSVEKLGGKIAVSSEVGLGTTFSISLPEKQYNTVIAS